MQTFVGKHVLTLVCATNHMKPVMHKKVFAYCGFPTHGHMCDFRWHGAGTITMATYLDDPENVSCSLGSGTGGSWWSASGSPPKHILDELPPPVYTMGDLASGFGKLKIDGNAVKPLHGTL